MKVLSIAEDKFNSKRTRNVTNSECTDYNCGGYALETFNWFLPYEKIDNEDTAYQLFEEGNYFEDVVKILLEKNVEYMLSKIPNLRRISSVDEAKDDERLIAYRVAIEIENFYMNNNGHYVPDYLDVDFHFRKKDPNDIEWSEKMGSGPISNCLSWEEEIWNEGYSNGAYQYCNPTALFALKIA